MTFYSQLLLSDLGPSSFMADNIYSFASMMTSDFRRLRNRTSVLASIGGFS